MRETLPPRGDFHEPLWRPIGDLLSLSAKTRNLQLRSRPSFVRWGIWNIHVHKVCIYEVYVQEVRAQDVHAYDMYACEVQAYGMHACDVQV
jgi:hypothetical protein